MARDFALVRFIPKNMGFPFVKWRKPAFVLSALAMLASVALLVIQGLNFGIDFRGGVLVEAQTEGAADLAKIRKLTNGLGLGDVQIQSFGEADKVLIRMEPPKGEAQQEENLSEQASLMLQDALSQEIQGFTIRRVEIVGPKVSGELIRAGIIAVLGALALMLIYIWIRFEWQFSLGAVVALTHDVLLTFGVFAITGLEFNLSIIAAILTIVGYSMNDTVIVYDRIRENLRKYKTSSLGEVINRSINETFSRTIMTSFTTLLALLALFFFGGQVLRGFSFALIWGVVVGTYSSIFVASPFLFLTGVRRSGDDT